MIYFSICNRYYLRICWVFTSQVHFPYAVIFFFWLVDSFSLLPIKKKKNREPNKLCILLRALRHNKSADCAYEQALTQRHPRTVSYEKSLEINGSHCRIFSKRRESQRATHAYRSIPQYRYLKVKIAHVAIETNNH